MAKNKRYKRKAKRLIGYCVNRKCCDCEHFKEYSHFNYYYGDIEYFECCDLKYGYEGEGYRWIENYFKGNSSKPFDLAKKN